MPKSVVGHYSRREALVAFGGLASIQPPEVAITIDDVAWSNIPEPFRRTASDKLLADLEEHGKLRAALFVTGRNVDSADGRAILQQWSDQGHVIANHTWTHHMYNASIEPEEFGAELVRCDRLVRPFAAFRPYFRFPALKEGSTRQRRDWMRAFLRERGYRNGAVTIDASDWYYDQRLRTRLTQDPGFDVNRFREPYLAHIMDRANFYDSLARQVLSRRVQHTLLIHFNLLNTLFLRDLVARFQSQGWKTVDAEAAFQDPVFRREPDTVPAGESLIWALAKETGRFETRLRYPGEDDTYEKASLDRLGL